jgi:hypothetical protein
MNFSHLGNFGTDIEYVLDGATPDLLYSIGVRYNNNKRHYLFVSKILGKHIPIRPNCLAQNCYELTSSWLEDSFSDGSLQSIEEPILVIGFAETATAMGHYFFTNIKDNVYYLHSTRDKIDGLDPLFSVDENHSYTTDHFFYLRDKTILEEVKNIVIIDDEITSGNTAYNLIKRIDEEYPGKNYSVACFLDWRGKESIRKYDKGLNGKSIKVIHFLKGIIHEEGVKNAQEYYTDLWDNITLKSSYVYWDTLNLNLPFYEFGNEKYLKFSGRFGLTEKNEILMQHEINSSRDKILKLSKGKKILVLGQGECMYVPNLISIMLSDNKNVYFHATTRSPALIFNSKWYGLKNGVHFGSLKGKDYTEFVYNILEKDYDELFLITESSCNQDNLGYFMLLMKNAGIKYLRHIVLT